MKCPICDSERTIVSVAQRFENDHTPDKPTELWNDFTLVCMNAQCGQFGWPGWKSENDSDRPPMDKIKLTTLHSVKVI